MDDALFTMVVLFVLAGCLIAPLAFGRDATTPNILLRVGHDVFTMLGVVASRPNASGAIRQPARTKRTTIVKRASSTERLGVR